MSCWRTRPSNTVANFRNWFCRVISKFSNSTCEMFCCEGYIFWPIGNVYLFRKLFYELTLVAFWVFQLFLTGSRKSPSCPNLRRFGRSTFQLVRLLKMGTPRLGQDDGLRLRSQLAFLNAYPHSSFRRFVGKMELKPSSSVIGRASLRYSCYQGRNTGIVLWGCFCSCRCKLFLFPCFLPLGRFWFSVLGTPPKIVYLAHTEHRM